MYDVYEKEYVYFRYVLMVIWECVSMFFCVVEKCNGLCGICKWICMYLCVYKIVKSV